MNSKCQSVLKLGISSPICERVLNSYNCQTVFRFLVFSALIADKEIFTSSSTAIFVFVDPYAVFIKRAFLTDSISCLFARPQYSKPRRTCAAFFTHNIRRRSARKNLEFFETTTGATFACYATRSVLRVCSFSAFHATRFFSLAAQCRKSCRALSTSQVD